MTNKIIVFDAEAMQEYGAGAKCAELSNVVKNQPGYMFAIPLISIKDSHPFSSELLKELLKYQKHHQDSSVLGHGISKSKKKYSKQKMKKQEE